MCKIVLVFWRAKCMWASQPPSPPPKSWKASRGFEKEPVNSEEWLAAAFISFMPLSKDPVVDERSPCFLVFVYELLLVDKRWVAALTGDSRFFKIVSLVLKLEHWQRKYTIMRFFFCLLHCNCVKTTAMLELNWFNCAVLLWKWRNIRSSRCWNQIFPSSFCSISKRLWFT